MEAERIAEKQKSLQRSSLLKRRWEEAGLLYWPQEWWENRWRVDNRREWRQVSASHKCQGHHSGFDRPLAQHSTSALLSFAAVSKSAYLYQWEQRGWLCASFYEHLGGSLKNSEKSVLWIIWNSLKIWNEGLVSKKQGNSRVFLGKNYWGLPSGLSQ